MFINYTLKQGCGTDSGPPFQGSAIPAIRVRVNRNLNPNPSPTLTLTPGMADPRNGGPVPWNKYATALTSQVMTAWLCVNSIVITIMCFDQQSCFFVHKVGFRYM